jgi:hypothetical protein
MLALTSPTVDAEGGTRNKLRSGCTANSEANDSLSRSKAVICAFDMVRQISAATNTAGIGLLFFAAKAR